MDFQKWSIILNSLEIGISVIGLLFIYNQLKANNKQLELSVKDFKDKFEFQKRERAVETAKEFERLLEHSNVIFAILSHTKINDMINNLELGAGKNRLKYFTYDELVRLIPEYKKLEKEFEFFNVLEKVDLKMLALIMQDYDDKEYHKGIIQYLYINNNFTEFTPQEIKNEKNNERKKEKMKYNSELSFFKKKIYKEIDSIFISTLNKLEYISMYFNCKIADENVVYNSLHQIFLSYIELCYIFIAQKNTDKKDKYFTNIIEFYNLWKDRYLKELEEENKIFEKNNTKITNFKDLGK